MLLPPVNARLVTDRRLGCGRRHLLLFTVFGRIDFLAHLLALRIRRLRFDRPVKYRCRYLGLIELRHLVLRNDNRRTFGLLLFRQLSFLPRFHPQRAPDSHDDHQYQMENQAQHEGKLQTASDNTVADMLQRPHRRSGGR